jgi:hypothetical protein
MLPVTDSLHALNLDLEKGKIKKLPVTDSILVLDWELESRR